VAVVIELSQQTVIEQLVERLAQTFPAVPPETIADAVRASYARFDGKPVRDYIPLFVERECRRRLADLGSQVGPERAVTAIQPGDEPIHLA
jgi:hypothetical protein